MGTIYRDGDCIMTKRFFPKDCGIAFVADVTIDGDHVSIPNFTFTLDDKEHQIAGGAFDVVVGDTIYITPQGLEKVQEKEYPEHVFESGSAYWLVSKTKDDILVLEVEK